MRVIIYIVILALMLLAPVERLDVAKLEPVQTVAIYMESDTVVLETDTESTGRGADVRQAYQDLEENTPGVIYLDTAEYLLVSEDAAAHVDALRQYLKPSVMVSLWDGEGSIKDAAKYLSVHYDLPELKDWKASDHGAVEKS